MPQGTELFRKAPGTTGQRPAAGITVTGRLDKQELVFGAGAESENRVTRSRPSRLRPAQPDRTAYRLLTIRVDGFRGRKPMSRLSAQRRRHSSSQWRPGDDAAQLKELTKAELIRLISKPATKDEGGQPSARMSGKTASTQPQAMLVNESVRSGQTVKFREGDVVILGSVGSGAEVVAGGSIHVFGALRGRAYAGTNGDSGARIVCQRHEAELLAIGGVHRICDGVDDGLRGRPAHAWLVSESIKVDAFGAAEAYASKPDPAPADTEPCSPLIADAAPGASDVRIPQQGRQRRLNWARYLGARIWWPAPKARACRA
jgi:septum site-determining protein MinC